MIPARYGSTRFPGKALADILGKPMIQHVHERASLAPSISDVIVATDDDRIARVVAGFGGRVVMTSPDHQSGTDRIAEAARTLDSDIIVNVQGDEPLIEPSAIEAAVRPLVDDPTLPMATLSVRIRSIDDLLSPGVVKVVCGITGDALYFSRSMIPFARDLGRHPTQDDLDAGRVIAFKHVGLYVYRREFLQRYASLSPSHLETVEKLEQLRVLEHGYRIRVVETSYDSVGVDEPSDLHRVIGRLSRPVT
jgi:3-deoxy-manno-octulosonate cytidylyltransferase (CMP-KDO synthetase)